MRAFLLVLLLCAGCTPMAKRSPEQLNVLPNQKGWKPLECRIEYVSTLHARGRCGNAGMFDDWEWGCIERIRGEWTVVAIYPWFLPKAVSAEVAAHFKAHCENGMRHVDAGVACDMTNDKHGF